MNTKPTETYPQNQTSDSKDARRLRWYSRKPVVISLIALLFIAVCFQASYIYRMKSGMEATETFGARLDRLEQSLVHQSLNKDKSMEDHRSSDDITRSFSTVDSWNWEFLKDFFDFPEQPNDFMADRLDWWRSPFDPDRNWFLRNPSWESKTSMRENEREFEVTMSVPEMKEHELDVTLEGRTLTVTGKKEISRTNDRPGSILLRSNTRSHFKKTYTFPEEVLSDQLKTKFENGKIIITVPKASQIS